MTKGLQKDLKSSLIAPVGWLFADLLLALAMLFLVANTFDVPAKPTPTPRVQVTKLPTPTAKPVKPTPTPIPSLNTASVEFTLTFDYQGLLNNSPSVINDLKQQIRSQSKLKGGRAGFVIMYGGGYPNQSALADQVVTMVQGVFMQLGTEGFVFIKTAYHSPLGDFADGLGTVNVEIYLYNK